MEVENMTEKRDTYTAVLMSHEQKERLKEKAKQEGRTMSSLMYWIMIQYIDGKLVLKD